MSVQDTAPASLDMDAPVEPGLAVKLLGGFSVERDGVPLPESAWQQRRASKMLLKLLALAPNHSLHREQILDQLWPEDEAQVSVKKFSKALHVARHALEPGLPWRGASSYLRMQDDVLALDVSRINVDVSTFRALGERALSSGRIADCEAAIRAYRGDLLPEDRYEDWVSDYRQALSDLLIEVYATAGDAYDRRGLFGEAVLRLRFAERLDPVREEVHRHLMRLYARMGKRHLALRQYQICRDVLQRELDVPPAPETDSLRADILGGRYAPSSTADAPAPGVAETDTIPLIGRRRILQTLLDHFERAKQGHGGTIFITGEIGVGKSRVVLEFTQHALDQGAVLMRGAGRAYDKPSGQYGPVVQALEAYISGLPMTRRLEIAQLWKRYFVHDLPVFLRLLVWTLVASRSTTSVPLEQASPMYAEDVLNPADAALGNTPVGRPL